MAISPHERFNFYSHLAGVGAAVIGTAALVQVAGYSFPTLITALIYGFGVIFLFSASACHHAFKKAEDELSFWRKLDHFAIFCMIAGTYTPVCHLYLEGAWRWSIIGVQWGLVGIGLLLQIFFPAAPRILTTSLYIVMGWIAVIPLRQILTAMTVGQAALLFAGGVAYTLGGVIYALKRPRLVPGIFSFHELFHLLVLTGAALLYALIFTAYLRFK
jgi:hemolysin III